MNFCYLCTRFNKKVMYDQIQEDVLYLMLYAGVMVLSLIACCYLLLRRANAFAPDVTPPLRLRRWTAAFFAATALCHLWYLPMYFLSSRDDVMMGYQIAGLLDCMTVIPLLIVLPLVMLQDCRRPLWTVWAMVMPLVAGRVWCIATRSDTLLLWLFGYFVLICIGFVVYIVWATRQYGRWLHDNYADLEHKEVWQSFVVLAIFLLTSAVYSFDMGDMAYEYMMEVNIVILVCYLLWRVETLSDLSTPVQTDTVLTTSDAEEETDTTENKGLSLTTSNNIGSLLKRHCEEPQLYLQHDISAVQLAKLIGTNRLYLSKYFASQGVTYNAYINGLRIQHFINLYHETVATHQPIAVQQLAHQSGFRSYSTFYLAFKQSMGMTASEWMRASKL